MVAHYLYKVGLIHGHAKLQYTMLSMVSRSFFFLLELLQDKAEHDNDRTCRSGSLK